MRCKLEHLLRIMQANTGPNTGGGRDGEGGADAPEFFKPPAFLKLTNTDPFAAWFILSWDATPDGKRVVRSVLGAISSFPIAAKCITKRRCWSRWRRWRGRSSTARLQPSSSASTSSTSKPLLSNPIKCDQLLTTHCSPTTPLQTS